MGIYFAGIVEDLGLNWVTVLTNVSATVTETIVGDLRPSTGYQFRVSAVNNVGEGSHSEPSNTVTLPQEGMNEHMTCWGKSSDLKITTRLSSH